MKLHFIAGLPRSGSTLLSALLYQNPRFWAGVSGPLAHLVGVQHKALSEGEFSQFFSDDGRAQILRGLFENYYSANDVDVSFDTNRAWTSRMPLLARLYPEARVICCVRKVGEVLDSFEAIFNRNPLRVPKVLQVGHGENVYSRTEALLDTTNGRVGLAWASFREAWHGPEAKRLIVIQYKHLVEYPATTLRGLYQELGEPYFEHDFEHVRLEQDVTAFDDYLGMPGLHSIRGAVALVERGPIIPPELLESSEHLNFWEDPEQNPNGVTIL
jgi:sulfotransferase